MNNAAEIPNTLALSPKRRREKKKRSPRGNVENLTQKWHMNDEHGASKRNSVLLVLLTKKQMVPIHKNEELYFTVVPPSDQDARNEIRYG